MSEKKGFLPIFLLLILSLIWGTSFILIKQGLKVFSPSILGALRITAAAVFLLPLAVARFRELKPGDGQKLFLSGIVGVFVPAFLFAIAQTQLNSSLAGILNTLSPLWTVIMGALFFSQRFRGYVVAGIIISFVGAVLLALSRSGGSITGFNMYALLIVIACAFYGTNVNWIKFKIHDLSSITITSVSIVLMGPLAAVYLFLFTDFVTVMKTEPGAWMAFGYIALLAFMSTALANLLFYKLLKITTPVFAASVTYIMPVVAVMWGVIDGEQLLPGHFIGMAAILGGVYLANRK
jgi:drug/metabolite transporter (DMT)-like permease